MGLRPLRASARPRLHVDFPLDEQRPHPPGYILYVGTAALARLGSGDTNLALVIVSAAAAAVAAVGIFALARRFASPRAALVAAGAFAASPLVWLYSEVAYPYTVLACASVLVAAGLWSARTGSASRAIAMSTGFGVAAGFRQDLILLLAPLWIWSVLPHGRRIRLAATAALATGTLVWLVPTVVLSDGIADYVDALMRQADSVTNTYSTASNGVPALIVNLGTTASALGWGLAFALAPLALAALMWLRPRRRVSASATFFILWIAPALLLYVVVHIGEWGYVLSVLPAGYVLTAVAIERLGARFRPGAALGSGWAAAIASALVFALSAGPFSAQAVGAHDDALGARVRYVREHFSPAHTAVLAREDYLLVRHYLPEYRVMFHDPDPYARAQKRMRTRDITQIVVFTSGLSPRPEVAVRHIKCARDVHLTYVPIPLGAVIIFDGERYAVRPPE